MSRRMSGWMHACVLSLFLVLTSVSYAQDGEKVFKQNCASCHKMDKKLIGPALQGAVQRWEDRPEGLRAWILNSTQYLKDHPEDSYAHKLFEDYNGTLMTAMALSNEDLEAVVSYIETWTPPIIVEEVKGDENGTTEQGESYTVYWLLAFAIILLVVTKVLIDVKKSVKKILIEVKGREALADLEEVDDLELSSKEKMAVWADKNKVAVGLVLAVVFVGILNVLYWSLMGVGVYENYAPEQPIKFSHKIHAGDNQINCVYCHSSAEKGKTSGIPSVNVCMNCHKGISEGKRWGTEEIAKIYDAAGWNPETSKYDKPEKPIKWIRIHNLPDHVYFNHSQHVVVGQVECQTCHGEVETFDYPMHQHAELTMGWCVNCHRETEVKMNGNAYYDKIHAELVEKYKDQGLEKFTVDQMGGLECAKCHY